MSTATIERTSPTIELLDATVAVADLDLDDTALWWRVDPAVAELVRVAYELTAAVTGEPVRTPATRLPPVVRIRELATAQRQLLDALDRRPAPAGWLVEATNRRVRRVVAQLRP